MAPLVGIALAAALTSCTPEGIARDAIDNRFRAGDVECAMNIAYRESRFQADAKNPNSSARGIFQVLWGTHGTWISSELGYTSADMYDAYKNAHAAYTLSEKARTSYKDRWQPWRYGGAIDKTEKCPAAAYPR